MLTEVSGEETMQRRRQTRSICALIVIALGIAGARPGRAATGGPDAFGYTWADSDEPTVDTTPPPFGSLDDLRAMGFMGDDAVMRIDLPVSAFPTGFPFYGARYPTIWLSTNGWLSFIDPLANSAPMARDIFDPVRPNGLFAWYWDDLTAETTGPIARGGAHSGDDGYSIILRVGAVSHPTDLIQMTITLWNTGVMQVIYTLGANQGLSPATVIGLENATGTDGLPYMASGAAQHGANFRDDYAVRYYPRGNLDCSGATAIACGDPATTFDNLAGANQVSAYNCAAGAFDGNERVLRLDLAQTSHLDISVSRFGARNMAAFLVRLSCSELSGCITGGSPTLMGRYIAPGTYHVVVDGATAADNGTFDLEVACTDATTGVTCGSVLVGEVTAGLNDIDQWSCQPGLTGPENVYSVDVAGPATLRASLANETNPDLHVVISDSRSFDVQAPQCVARGTAQATVWGAETATYFVAVDGLSGASGSYDLTVTCEHLLQCGGATPIDVSDPTPITGDTSGQPNVVESYRCARSAFGSPGETGGYTGGEQIYQFDVTTASIVSFLFDPSNPDMRMLIVSDDCYEGSCVMEGSCGENLTPGTYYLVVDGLNGASGSYSFTPFVVPAAPYTPWFACSNAECRGAQGCGQTADEIRRKRYQFNSENFCGTGCNFSLFVVVECGTEFHIPFWDVETGHMQIYDILQEQYLDLVATNELPSNRFPPTEPHTSTGPLVEWRDRDCSQIPCPARGCGGGSDPKTNGVVMDVSFQGNPTVCGVYRLDFIDWGGWFWEVYANCTADRTEQFYIYRDLCSALANYNPRPEGGLADVTFDQSQCGSRRASGTFTVENVGCLPASGLEIVIDEVPSQGSPKTYTVDLLRGEQKIIPWTYDISTVPVDLTFRVDPADRTPECSENLGTTVQCGSNSALVRTFTGPACPQECSTVAIAGPSSKICEGEDYILDGSASSFICIDGTPQYRWLDRAGNDVCPPSSTPNCTLPAAQLGAGQHSFTLETECTSDTPPCVDRSNVLIDVSANVQPPPVGNYLRAVRQFDSIRFSWVASAGAEVSTYRLFRGGDPQLPAATRRLVQEVSALTSTASDEGAMVMPPNPGFYQVVGTSCLGDLEGPY